MFSGHCSFLPHSRNLNVWTTRCECVSESVCPETTRRRGRVLARRLMGLVPALRSWFWISKVDGRTRWIKKNILNECKNKTETVGKRQKPQRSKQWCAWWKRGKRRLRERGVRSGIQRREAVVRGNIKWPLRSPKHTGFDTPNGFILTSTCSPGNRHARRTAWSPSSPLTLLTVIKTVQSGLQIASGRKAAVTQGDLLNYQKERPRVNNNDPDNHKLSIDVFLRAQRRWS